MSIPAMSEVEHEGLLKLVDDLIAYKNRNSRILGSRFEHLPGLLDASFACHGHA
jgi:hypothetical protein